MQSLACEACGNRVRVEKFGPHQISVQWASMAAGVCPRLAADDSTQRPATGSCPDLQLSIDAQIRSGALAESTRHEEPTHGVY